MLWSRSGLHLPLVYWVGIRSWDVSGVALDVVAAAVAAIVVAEAGSESHSAAGRLAWWVKREALQTEERARLDLSCCCSRRSGRSRTAGGRRLGEWEIAGITGTYSWSWRWFTFGGFRGFFKGWRKEEVSKEWRETTVYAVASAC